MLSLRGYLLLVSAAVVGGIWLFFQVQTQHVLGGVFGNLQSVHLKTVSETARSLVEAKRYTLSTYNGLLGNDNELSSAFILAKANGHSDSLQKKLTSLTGKMGLDYVTLIGFDQSHFGSDLSPVPTELTAKIARGESIFEISSLKEEPVLLSLSPLRNFGEVVGVLALGYRLNGILSSEVSETTGARVRFLSNTASTVTPGAQTGVLEIELGEGQTAKLAFQEESKDMSDLAEKTRANITWLAGASLLLLFLLLYLGLEFGFVRKFTSILSHIDEAAHDLDRGIIRPPALPEKSSVREIGRLSGAFSTFSESLESFSHKIALKSRKEAFVEVAEQVAHDLKSPLSALDMMLSPDNLKDFPEKRRLRIHRCVERIKDILQVLSAKKNEADRSDFVLSPEEADTHALLAVVESIVSEKKIQYRSGSVSLSLSALPQSQGLYATIRVRDFKSALSNLIDNAVQALENSGKVKVELGSEGDEIVLTVTDNGKGVAPDVLPRLGERGATFGKEGGSGLGLWNAKQVVAEAGGSLTLTSEEGRGTTVTVRLPKASLPEWAASELRFPARGEIIVIDDDREMHEIWKERLASLSLERNTRHFTSIKEFEEWSAHSERPAFVICDYEFINESKNGLDVIESLPYKDRCVLVTSHHEDREVRMRCAKLGIKMIPKDHLSLIPLALQEQAEEDLSHA